VACSRRKRGCRSPPLHTVDGNDDRLHVLVRKAWARHLDQIISGTTASVLPIMRAGGDRADAGNANN